MADSNSSLGLQANTRQQTMILYEQSCTLPKTLKTQEEKESCCVDKVEALFSYRVPSIKGIGDIFKAIMIAV